jgi:hypothetical protein
MKRPPIRVVSDAEAERCDYMVCVRLADDPGAFTDNLQGECCACGALVIFRPYAPAMPPRICVECVTQLAKGPQ